MVHRMLTPIFDGVLELKVSKSQFWAYVLKENKVNTVMYENKNRSVGPVLI